MIYGYKILKNRSLLAMIGFFYCAIGHVCCGRATGMLLLQQRNQNRILTNKKIRI